MIKYCADARKLIKFWPKSRANWSNIDQYCAMQQKPGLVKKWSMRDRPHRGIVN